jgi:hypothetical protein
MHAGLQAAFIRTNGGGFSNCCLKKLFTSNKMRFLNAAMLERFAAHLRSNDNEEDLYSIVVTHTTRTRDAIEETLLLHFKPEELFFCDGRDRKINNSVKVILWSSMDIFPMQSSTIIGPRRRCSLTKLRHMRVLRRNSLLWVSARLLLHIHRPGILLHMLRHLVFRNVVAAMHLALDGGWYRCRHVFVYGDLKRINHIFIYNIPKPSLPR